MRRYFILTFVLLLVVVVLVILPTDILDGGGFSYAILTQAHFHPLSSSQVSPLSQPNAHSAMAEAASLAGTSGDEALPATTPPKLARVLRC